MREVTRDVGRESKYDRIYRRIEAMYHKGFSIEGIVKQFPNLPRFEVLAAGICTTIDTDVSSGYLMNIENKTIHRLQ